jgi:hypothetical protein
MLARDNKGMPKLSAIKAQPYSDQPSPGDVNQEQAPPVVELPHAWPDLSLGFGLTVDTPEQQSHKYRNTLGADASIGGFIMKGPLITTCTPATRDATNGITQFVELPSGALFAMNGRYVQQRTSDNTTTGWGASPVKDFGVGVSCINACVHTSDGGTPANPTIYAAMNSTNKAQYSSDGATWTSFASFVALDFFTVSRQLWRCSDVNQVSSCDAVADPTNEANWTNSNSFRIGDKSFPINQVHVSSVGYPIFMKQDGIYTLDTSGQDFRLYPFFQFGASPEDGHYVWDFGNDTHVTYGNEHVRLVPTISFGNPHTELQPVGPERIPENTSEVHGRLTAGVGDGTLGAYAGLYNQDNGNSYLMKFSSWVGPSLQEGKLEEAQRIDAWHGSLSQPFVGKKITAMHRSRVGAPSGHYRCYIGFSDGTIAWFNLSCTPMPYQCAISGNYQFDNVTDGVLNLALFHGGHMAEAKSLRGFSVSGLQLTTTEYAMFNYKLSTASAAYSPFVDVNGSQVQYNSTPLMRADFQVGTSSYLADIQLVLHNTFTSASPIISTPTLHYAVITPVALRYQGIVDASLTVRRDGRPMRRGAQAIRNILKSAADSTTGVSITLPDGTTRTFTMIVYGENLAWTERDRAWDAAIPFEIVEYNPNFSPVSATHLHGVIANLTPTTINDLTSYSLLDLNNL